MIMTKSSMLDVAEIFPINVVMIQISWFLKDFGIPKGRYELNI